MRSFEFSLDSVFTMKENTEKQLKLKLKKNENLLAQLSEALAEYQAENAKMKVEFAKAAKSGIGIQRAVSYESYFRKLDLKIVDIIENIRKVEEQKKALLGELVLIRKDIKMLESLYEREYTAFMKTAKKKEEKAAEEFMLHEVTVY